MNKIKYFMVFLLTAAFVGCSTDGEVIAPAGQDEKITQVEFIAVEDPMHPISRAMSENGVNGYSSWIYYNSGQLIQSTSSANFVSSLSSLGATVNQKYRFAACVNDSGISYPYSDNPDKLGNIWWDYQTILKSGRIPMSYYAKDIVFPYNFGYQLYYMVGLKRVLARIKVNVTVVESAGDITLRSLEIGNVPDKVQIFEVEPTLPVELVYTDMAVNDAKIEGNTIAATVYLPENMQGENPAVTTPEEKYAANAPEHATHIRIRATASGRPVNYHIYIGENKTGDFNLRRNTAHTYNITITGADPADRRIEFILDDGERDAPH